FTDKWVSRNLESKCRHWLSSVRLALDFIATFWMLTPYRTTIKRTWQEISVGSQKLLHNNSATITTRNREEFTCKRSCSDSLADFVLAQTFFANFEVLF